LEWNGGFSKFKKYIAKDKGLFPLSLRKTTQELARVKYPRVDERAESKIEVSERG